MPQNQDSKTDKEREEVKYVSYHPYVSSRANADEGASFKVLALTKKGSATPFRKIFFLYSFNDDKKYVSHLIYGLSI